MYRRKREGERGRDYQERCSISGGNQQQAQVTSTGLDSISETETDTHKHSKTQAFPQFPRLDSEREREQQSDSARARARESYVSLSPPGSSRDQHRNTLKHRPYPHSRDSWQLPHPEEVSRGGCRLRGREEGREKRARERERGRERGREW
jgi:hypothetical protein